MQTPFESLIALLGFGTLILNSVTILGLILFFGTSKSSKNSFMLMLSSKIHKNSMVIAFIIATVATLSSLFLSEIVNFVPCKLCWYQRIVMYPQVVILTIAFFKNDMRGKTYALVLSIIGVIIALYHIALQYYPGILPCSDEVANCTLKQFEYFGYITIPVMSGSAFLALIVVLLFGLRRNK